jgi:hypothetical protein
MAGLTILEAACLVIYLLVFIFTLQIDRDSEKFQNAFIENLVYSLLCLLLEIGSIYILIVFGLQSLYFKMSQRLVLYIIL